MPGRPDIAERPLTAPRHDLVDRQDPGAGGQQRGPPGLAVHDRVGIEGLILARLRLPLLKGIKMSRRMHPEQVFTAGRAGFERPHPLQKTVFLQGLVHDADAIRLFEMPRPHLVEGAVRVGQVGHSHGFLSMPARG